MAVYRPPPLLPICFLFLLRGASLVFGANFGPEFGIDPFDCSEVFKAFAGPNLLLKYEPAVISDEIWQTVECDDGASPGNVKFPGSDFEPSTPVQVPGIHILHHHPLSDSSDSDKKVVTIFNFGPVPDFVDRKTLQSDNTNSSRANILSFNMRNLFPSDHKAVCIGLYDHIFKIKDRQAEFNQLGEPDKDKNALVVFTKLLSLGSNTVGSCYINKCGDPNDTSDTLSIRIPYLLCAVNAPLDNNQAYITTRDEAFTDLPARDDFLPTIFQFAERLHSKHEEFKEKKSEAGLVQLGLIESIEAKLKELKASVQTKKAANVVKMKELVERIETLDKSLDAAKTEAAKLRGFRYHKKSGDNSGHEDDKDGEDDEDEPVGDSGHWVSASSPVIVLALSVQVCASLFT